GLHDLVVSLVHWGLYELPSLNLDDIDIPVLSCAGGALPTTEQILSLKATVLNSIRELESLHPGSGLQQIIKEIEHFAPDPAGIDAFFKTRESDHLSLTNGGSGTHFLIGPSNPVLK